VWTEYGLVLINGIPAYQSIAESYPAPNGNVLTVGVWTHLAVTVASNRVITFYVNGTKTGTVSAATGRVVTASTQPFTIGNEAASATSFRGAIDEPALYDHALTPEQLARHVATATQKT
jgi:hypothetical protein